MSKLLFYKAGPTKSVACPIDHLSSSVWFGCGAVNFSQTPGNLFVYIFYFLSSWLLCNYDCKLTCKTMQTKHNKNHLKLKEITLSSKWNIKMIILWHFSSSYSPLSPKMLQFLPGNAKNIMRDALFLWIHFHILNVEEGF